jgi:hypothetical protein
LSDSQTTTSDPPNAVGESYLVSNSDMCGSPANTRPFARHLHRARLAGLVPGAYYRYAIAGGNGGDAEPAIFGFRAAPRPGPDGTVTLAVVGDVGWSHHPASSRRSKSPGADAVLRAIAADVEDDRADAVVVVGDVAYADGDIDVWDGFMASIGGQGGAGGEEEQREQGDDDDEGGEGGGGGGDRGRSSSPITYAALAARVPLMIAAGNHEYSYEEGWDHTDPSGGRPYTPEWRNWGNDSGGECGAMIARRFWMPRSGGGRRMAVDGGSSNGEAAEHPLDFDLFQPRFNRTAAAADGSSNANGRSSSSSSSSSSDLRALPPFWYAFDYGPVHVAVVSSEHDLEPGSRQRNWLEADLRSVDRCVSPWLVLAIHRPLYVVYPHKSNRYVGDHLRASLEPLLREYRVDAAVSGHVHVYYRTCPVVAGGGETGGGSDGRCVDERDRDSGAMSGADALRMAASPAANSSSSLLSEQQSNHFGTVHLVVGSGGHKLSGASGDQPRWVRALFDREYGYLRLKAKGGERLVVEFVSPADEGDEMRSEVERRVLDRVTYEGGEHHAAACEESRARLGLGVGAAAEEQFAVV